MAEYVDVNGPWSDLALGGKGTSSFRRQLSTKGVGKNYRLDIEAEGLVVNLDAREINATFGAGLQEILAAQIRNVTEVAAPATLARRRRHAANPATSSYRRRYAGGRIGEMAPDSTSVRKFNDSGRLALTTVRLRERSGGTAAATINFPANRFDPRTGGDISNIIRDAQRLIPMLGGRADPKTRSQFDGMLVALADGAVAKSIAQLKAKQAKLRAIQRSILKQIAGAVFGG